MDLVTDVTRREKIRLALEPSPEFTGDADDDAMSSDHADGADGAAVATVAHGSADGVGVPGHEAAAGVADDAVMFRGSMGKIVSLADVPHHLPVAADLPFSVPVPFRDRLGYFLADAVPHFSGEFPQPDDGAITIFPVAFLTSDGGEQFRVHARDAFYGKPAYSFVEARGTDNARWFGRVWLLFQCRFRRTLYNIALVSWLTQCSGAPYGTDKRTFTWTSRHVDCIELGHLQRVVTLVPSFMTRGAHRERILHLVE